MRQRSDPNPDSMGAVAMLHLALGQNDTVMAMLPRMCATAPGVCGNISVNPLWSPLHGDPRFEALVEKVTAPPPVAAASSP